MSRLLDAVILLASIFGILVVQTSGAVILDELRNEFNENADESLNQASNNDQSFVAVVKWVPTIGLFGLIIIVAFREFRRQRVTGVQRRRI